MLQHRVRLDRGIMCLVALGLVTLLGLRGSVARAQDYSTGFEAADGWVPGFVCGPDFADCTDAVSNPEENCGPDNPNPLTGWYLLGSATSCAEPHIDTVNPFEGSQHLRFAQDPVRAEDCMSFSAECQTSALSPLVTASPDVAITTASMEVTSSATFGSDLRIIPQSAAGAFPGTYVYISYYGTLQIYDDERVCPNAS